VVTIGLVPPDRGGTSLACLQYWFFANLQTLMEQAMLADAADRAANTAAGSSHGSAGDAGQPADLATAAAATPPLLPLSLSLKPFPWPAVALDLGATAAALFFNMLLVFAFLQPTRSGESRACAHCPLSWPSRRGSRTLSESRHSRSQGKHPASFPGAAAYASVVVEQPML
jgi:hypothetical protein